MSGKSYTKTIKDLSPVLYEYIDEPNRAVYEVHRGKLDPETKTCYDETTIFNGLMGVELSKTFGHYHPRNKEGYFFPELYALLEGRAWFLLQKPERSNPKIIKEALLVEAVRGEKIVMPPEFGHASANPEKKDLKLGNWKAEFDNDYQIYEILHGACYYFLESKEGSINIIKNSHYEMVPELIKVKPKKLSKELENLEFLTNPEKYLNLLTVENCFEKI